MTYHRKLLFGFTVAFLSIPISIHGQEIPIVSTQEADQLYPNTRSINQEVNDAQRVSRLDNKIDNLESQILVLEKQIRDRDAATFSFPFKSLLISGANLLGLLGVVISAMAIARVRRQRIAFNDLNKRYQSLATRVGGIEVQLEQERFENRRHGKNGPLESLQTQTKLPAVSTVSVPDSITSPASAQAVAAVYNNDLDPSRQMAGAEVSISKAGLIQAINTGDRQQLREAATAELNITSESENAIATGRSVSTELEQVVGGGSYWLVSVDKQDLLFPTERTLRGFANAQPVKGLFSYEQLTVGQPQLIEPAILEKTERGWIVRIMGRVAVP